VFYRVRAPISIRVNHGLSPSVFKLSQRVALFSVYSCESALSLLPSTFLIHFSSKYIIFLPFLWCYYCCLIFMRWMQNRIGTLVLLTHVRAPIHYFYLHLALFQLSVVHTARGGSLLLLRSYLKYFSRRPNSQLNINLSILYALL